MEVRVINRDALLLAARKSECAYAQSLLDAGHPITETTALALATFELIDQIKLLRGALLHPPKPAGQLDGPCSRPPL